MGLGGTRFQIGYSDSLPDSFLFPAELMVLGFISLLLTFGQNYIAKICIPEKAGNTMLPCPAGHHKAAEHHEPPAAHHEAPEHHEPPAAHHEAAEHHEPPENEHHQQPEAAAAEHHRRLLWSMRRILSSDSPPEECKEVSMSQYHTLDLPSEIQLIKLVLCCIGVLGVEDIFVIYFSQHIFTERKFVPSYYLPELNIVGKLKGIII